MGAVDDKVAGLPRTTSARGHHQLWKVRRHANWGWLLVTRGAFKSSFAFPARHEPDDGVITAQHVFLSSQEESGMLGAAHRSMLGIK